MQQQQQPYGVQLVRPAYRATEEQFGVFVRGLTAVLNQWTALHLVAQHCDPNAFPTLHRDLIDWHQRDGEVYADDLQLFFEDFFGSARSVIMEDDSPEEVSVLLHDMYCRCCQNDFTKVEQFVMSEAFYRQSNPLALCVNGGTSMEGEGEDFALGLSGNYASLDEAAAADVGDAEEGEEEEAEVQRQQQQQPKVYRKKKNAYKKSSDGWNYIV